MLNEKEVLPKFPEDSEYCSVPFKEWRNKIVPELQKELNHGDLEFSADNCAYCKLVKKLLVSLSSFSLKCPDCGTLMVVGDVRDDGCRYFVCSKCGCDVAEETEEWFKRMETQKIE